MEQEAAAAQQFAPSMPDNVDSGRPGLGRGLKTAGQLGLSAATHLISGPIAEAAAGLFARATNQDPNAAHELARKYAVYETPEGSDARAYTDKLSAATAPVTNAMGGAVHTADDFVGKYGGADAQKYVRQAAGTFSDILGVAPAAGAVAKGVSELSAAARPVAEAAEVARAPDELAAASGIKIPPSIQEATTGASKPGVLQTTLESMGGRSIIRRADIIRAKGQVNDLVKDANGIPKDRVLSDASYALAEQPHAAVYREVEAAIPDRVAIDPQTQAEMAQAGARENSLRKIPQSAEKARADAATIQAANGTEFKATISDYREKGYAALRSDDVDQQAFGRANLDIANALEAQMKRQIEQTNPGLAARFDAARAGFAKINDARAATVGHDIDPQMMRKIADANKGVTGEYRLIADLAERYPKILTNKVPNRASTVLSHVVGPGVAGSLGYHFGGAPGMAIGLAGASAGQIGARIILDSARKVTANPRVALRTALADYADKKAARGMHPSQKPPGKGLAMVPGRSYEPPIPPRGPDGRPMRNEGLNAGDRRPGATTHPAQPRPARPAPLALPAPGGTAPRAAKARDASTASHGELIAALTRQNRTGPALHISDTPSAGPTLTRGIPLHKVLVGDLALEPGRKAVTTALANRRSHGLAFADKLEGKRGMFPPLNKAGRKELRNRSER